MATYYHYSQAIPEPYSNTIPCIGIPYSCVSLRFAAETLAFPSLASPASSRDRSTLVGFITFRCRSARSECLPSHGTASGVNDIRFAHDGYSVAVPETDTAVSFMSVRQFPTTLLRSRLTLRALHRAPVRRPARRRHQGRYLRERGQHHRHASRGAGRRDHRQGHGSAGERATGLATRPCVGAHQRRRAAA